MDEHDWLPTNRAGFKSSMSHQYVAGSSVDRATLPSATAHRLLAAVGWVGRRFESASVHHDIPQSWIVGGVLSPNTTVRVRAGVPKFGTVVIMAKTLLLQGSNQGSIPCGSTKYVLMAERLCTWLLTSDHEGSTPSQHTISAVGGVDTQALANRFHTGANPVRSSIRTVGQIG